MTERSPPGTRRGGLFASKPAGMEGTPHRTPKLVEVRFTKWVKALIELAVRLNGTGEQRRLDKKGVNTSAGSW